jgi:hypothetical protein
MYNFNMQGNGLLKRIEMRKLFKGRQFWRTNMMLHQLTLFGQMLQTDNSDQLWKNCLASYLRQPPGLGWKSLSRGLAFLPRGFVRAVLWQASHDWLVKKLEAQLSLYQALSQSDLAILLLTDEDLKTDHRFYQETLVKLTELREVRTSIKNDDLELIEIVNEDDIKRMLDELEEN